MSQSNAIATANNVRSLTPAQQSSIAPWGEMMAQADVLVRSGFLPASVKTAEQAVAIILSGDELGLPKMFSLRSIHIVQGRPTLSADLMASLVLREIDRHRDGLLMVQPPTAEACTVRFRRWGWKEEQSYTYTITDAQRAGLAGKETWKQHPAAMLRARATAAACRMAFPDVVAGLYAVGEIPDEENAEDAPLGAGEPDARGQEPELGNADADVIDGEIVDESTGEILSDRPSLPPVPIINAAPDETIQQIDDKIKALRERLGWSASDVIDEAAKQGIDLTSKRGRQAMARTLEAWVKGA